MIATIVLLLAGIPSSGDAKSDYGLEHPKFVDEHQWSVRQIYGNNGNCRNGDYPRQCGENWDYTGFPKGQKVRADAVIEMFRFAWDGYYKYAFPNDDLLPQNNSFRNSRNGWALTAVDSLDTAIIMEQEDIVNDILDYIPQIDFTKNNAKPPNPAWSSLFETNIRYLGGLLAAYDLLKGPFSHLSVRQKNVDALLTQAKTLADALKFAFDTPTGIPWGYLYIDNQTFYDGSEGQLVGPNGERFAGLAEIGTLVLEWQHLSDLTGDPSYGDLVQRVESYWFNGAEVWPGLTGGNFSIDTGDIVDVYGGWTSGNDSAYEYLIKMFVYDPDRYGNYSKRWQEAADSTIEHLLSSPRTRPDLVTAGAFSGKVVQNYSEQLECFIGGNFILGSSTLKESSKSEQYLDTGLKFSEWCANGYRSTASGIGPVIYAWNDTILYNVTNNFTNQTTLYENAGFYIPSNQAFGGGQTPEAVESWYYAYQATNDQYWRDVAWAFTIAQNETQRVGSGFASLKNVLVKDGNGTGNFMASFMLAEVLKYQYLIQDPKGGVWDVISGDEKVNHFVYNTEAHPFKVAARKPV